MRDLKIWMLGCGVWAMVLVSGNLPTLAAEDNPGAVATPAPTMVVTEATPTATPTPGPSAKKFEFYGFVRTDVIW